MGQHLRNKEKIFIEIDTTELSSAQIRAIKTLNHMLTHVLTTVEEGEYFDGSAETMRICASLIKQAKFISGFDDENIPYAQQALEYSIDVLQEHMTSAKVVTYDN